MYVVYFEPLKLDTGRTVTQPGTMYNQTPAQSEQRACTEYSFSGAQHLPAHSVALRSSTKAKDSKAGSGQFDANRQFDTGGSAAHRGLVHRSGQNIFSVERKTGQKENKLGAEKAHTLTSVPTEAMVPGRKLRPPWNYVTLIDARTKLKKPHLKAAFEELLY